MPVANSGLGRMGAQLPESLPPFFLKGSRGCLRGEERQITVWKHYFDWDSSSQPVATLIDVLAKRKREVAYRRAIARRSSMPGGAVR